MGGFPRQGDSARPVPFIGASPSGEISFIKYEGLGNDFVVVEAEREEEVPLALASELCDRRFGIGADGVLVVLPAAHPAHAARMRVINADGSIPEMCGNGLRCVALHLARRSGAEGTWHGTVETDAGPRVCSLEGEGSEAWVDVDMGVVQTLGEREIEVSGERLTLHLADAGNPHAILFGERSRADMERLGAALAVHPSFERGANIEFVRPHPDVAEGFDVFVWERGVGPTLACGTGACAVAAVAVALGKASRGVPLRVRLPGGELAVTLDEGGRAEMRGPARLVFRGSVAPRTVTC